MPRKTTEIDLEQVLSLQLHDDDDTCTGCRRPRCPCASNCRCAEFCRCVSKGPKSSNYLEKEAGDIVNDPFRLKSKKGGDDGVMEIQLNIDGMTCTMCSSAVQKAIRLLDKEGKYVQECNINALDGVGVVAVGHPEEARADGITLESIVDAVECMGYGCEGVVLSVADESTATNLNGEHVEENDADDDDGSEILTLADRETEDEEVHNMKKEEARHQAMVVEKRKQFLISLIGSLPIMFLSMVYPYFGLEEYELRTGLSLESTVMWVLATFVQFYCGHVFYRGAYVGIRNRSLGMDVLIAIGTTAAYVYAVLLIMLGMFDHDSDGSSHNSNDHGSKSGQNHGAHFFETSAVLISFVFLGHWLQALAVRRTNGALMKLMNLQSKTAVLVIPEHRINEDPLSVDSISDEPDSIFDPSIQTYTERIVPIKEVSVGDIIKIIRGASIPTDAILIHGTLEVNEAAMTGESTPAVRIACQPNVLIENNAGVRAKRSVLLGGTICVDGVGFAQVTSVGSKTALAQIITMIQRAQMSSAPIQDFADRVSSIFVPIVVFISILTFVVWMLVLYLTDFPEDLLDGNSNITLALLFSISCLVISCPCALGLATPTAIMVGTGVGALNGILIKGGETLEAASKVSCVVFDKTGTLSIGRPRVQNFRRIRSKLSQQTKDETSALCDMDDDVLLWNLAVLERNSEHPLAEAIVRFVEDSIPTYLKSNPLAQPDSFNAITGKGASCQVGDHLVGIGNRSFGEGLGVSLSNETEKILSDFEAQGMTAVICIIDCEICGVLGISDVIRDDSRATVSKLKEMNINVWMVTGDNRRTAESVATKVGIDFENVVSEALPVDKVDVIKSLQREGEVVAMVGDGINDSPALVQSDVGIAISGDANHKVEIAAEAADMVIINQTHSVWTVLVCLELTRLIFSRIKLNYVWALLYNTCGIPIAAGIFYPLLNWKLEPTLASIAMALSSISVVISSLTLKLFVPSKFVSK